MKATLVCGPSGAQYSEVTETYSNSWNLGDCCNSASDTWSNTQSFGGEYEIKNGMFYADFSASEFDGAEITMTLTAYNGGSEVGTVSESFSLDGRYDSYGSKSMNLASLPDQPVTDVEYTADVTVNNEDNVGVDLKWDYLRTPY